MEQAKIETSTHAGCVPSASYGRQQPEPAVEAEPRRAEPVRWKDKEIFHSLGASCPVGIFLVDTKGNCSDLSFRCRDIFGLSSMESVSAGWTLAIPPEDRQAVVERWFACLRQGVSYSSEFRICHPQRGIRWIHLRSAPMFSDKSALLGHVATVDDLTERKQADDKLRRYAERLETLHEIDRDILYTRSSALIAQSALIRIRQLAQCQWGCVAQFILKSRKAEVLAAYGPGKSAIEAGTILPMKEFELGKRAADVQGRLQWVEDVSSLPQRSLVVQLLQAERLRACLSVPLVSRERVVGVLTLAASSPETFTAENLEVAREEADSLALVVQHAGLREQVRADCKQLEIMSRRLVQSHEDERRQIAGELHDEIGQGLTALKSNLQGMAREAPVRIVNPRLQESLQLIERTIQQVRDLSVALRPSVLDDLGLVAALRWQTDRMAHRSGLTAHFVADPLPTRLPAEIEIACYRVAQESLNNVVRHAQARQVRIELRRVGGELRLMVRDDGLGFNARAARLRAVRGDSFGLLGMEERVLLLGGSFKIKSAPQGGTQVRACFPLTQSTLKKTTKTGSL